MTTPPATYKRERKEAQTATETTPGVQRGRPRERTPSSVKVRLDSSLSEVSSRDAEERLPLPPGDLSSEDDQPLQRWRRNTKPKKGPSQNILSVSGIAAVDRTWRIP